MSYETHHLGNVKTGVITFSYITQTGRGDINNYRRFVTRDVQSILVLMKRISHPSKFKKVYIRLKQSVRPITSNMFSKFQNNKRSQNFKTKITKLKMIFISE